MSTKVSAFSAQKTVLFNTADFAEQYNVFKAENPDWQLSSHLVSKASKICLGLEYQPSSIHPELDSICVEYNWFKGQYLYFSIREEELLMMREGQQSISISPSEINGYIWNILEPNVFQLILVSNGLSLDEETYQEYICAASNLFLAEIIHYGWAEVTPRDQYLYNKWKANQFKTKTANMYGLSVANLIPSWLKEEKDIPYRRLEKMYEDEYDRYTVALAVGPITNKERQEIITFDRYAERNGKRSASR